MDKKKLAKYLDLANHHADATPEDIERLCRAVKEHGFHTVFVNPCYVAWAKELLGNRGKVGTVVSFPLGQETRDSKVLAAIEAARKGADELDVSMNVGLFKAGQTAAVLEEMRAVIEGAKNIKEKILVKFIIETGSLTEGEIAKASELVVEAGADFIKTCSGWGPRGARLTDVELIKKAIGKKVKIKVAGGIRTYKKAIAFIKAGVHRIGTSRAVEIVNER